MMGRRRDELYARGCVAQLGDVLGNLAAWQLPALARLRSLCDLDLDLLCGIKILRGYPETARSHLLDFRLKRIALFELDVALDAIASQARPQGFTSADRFVAAPVFAALTGIGLAADAIHGDRQIGVRFGGNGTERHGARSKAPDDVFR